MAATLALPDLSSLTGSRDGILGAVGTIAHALPDDPSSLVSSLTSGSGALGSALHVDSASLTGGLGNALQSLHGTIPGAPPELQQLLTAVTGALTALEPLKNTLTHDGQLLDLKSLALQQTGDPAQRIGELIGPLSTIAPPAEIEALQTFVDLVTGFESSVPTQVDQIAGFVARGFLGVAPDVLAPARSALDGFVGSANALAPQASVNAAHAAAASLVTELGSARTLVLALDPTDASAYGPVLQALTEARTAVQALAAQVNTLAAGFRSGLASLDHNAMLTSIESALAAVPEIQAPDAGAFFEIVTSPIRELNTLIDSVTPEQLAAQLRRGSDFAAHELLAVGLDDLTAMLRKPFEDIGHAIEGLQLQRIHDAFRDALAPVHDAIASVTGEVESLRNELTTALNGAASAIGTLTSAASEVETALDQLATEIQTAAGGIDLSSFHDEAKQLIDELSQSIQDVVGEASEALGKLHNLIGQLGQVDLHEAASAATDAINQLTQTISSIDTSQIPDALLNELKSALTSLLGHISLQPVHDAISQAIDAASLDVLDEFVQAYESVLHELEGFSPSGLLQPLEQPFDDAIRRLNDLSPAALLDPVIGELQQAKSALDGLSPATLLAPLDAPLQAAKSALDQAKPSHLLEPLHEPFAEVLALVDKLDGKAALEAIEAELGSWMQQGLGGLQSVGGAFEGGGGAKALADVAASGGARPEDFGLRPGDILTPVQELYEKVIGLLNQVPIDSLLAAFEQVRSAIVGTLDALRHLPSYLHDEIAAAVDAFDVAGSGGFASGLFAAHLELVAAVDGIDPSRVPNTASAKHAQLASLTADLNPSAAFAPALAELQGLRTDLLALVGSVETGVLGSLAQVAGRLEALIPPFLRQPVTADALHQALDDLNPKHLADEVNSEFDTLMQKLLTFASTLANELPQVVNAWTSKIEHGLDGLIRDAFEAVHAPLKAQLETLDPATFGADLDHELFDPVKSTLDDLSIESIAGPALETTLNDAKTALDGVITALGNVKTSVGSAYQNALNSLVAVSPRSLEADLQQAYAPIATALQQLDLGNVTDELKAAIQKIGDQAADVLQAVLDALKAMVAAIPSGVGEGVGGDASFGL